MGFFSRQGVKLREPARDDIELPLRNNPDTNGSAAAANEISDNKNPAQDPSYKQAQSRRKWIIIALIGLTFFIFSGVKYKKPSVEKITNFFKGSLTVQNINLHLLVPNIQATEMVDVGICRMVLCASVLGYPTPWLIDYVSGQPEAQRILNYLEANTQPEDIAIVTENTWFQLRSEVLVQRYYDIIAANNKARNKNPSLGPVQNILMATESGAPNHHLVIGRSSDLQSAYRYAIQNNYKLSHVYTTQQDTPTEPLTYHNTDTNTDEPVSFGIGLDTTSSLLADITTLTATLPAGGKNPDFASSLPPHWTVAGFKSSNLPNATWAETTLLSLTSSNTVPALIQHDPSLPQPDIQASWFSLWYHEHSRRLLDFSARRAAEPLAIVVDGAGKPKVEVRLWEKDVPVAGKRVVGVWHTKDKQVHAWKDICGWGEEAKVIFGDGGGEWQGGEV